MQSKPTEKIEVSSSYYDKEFNSTVGSYKKARETGAENLNELGEDLGEIGAKKYMEKEHPSAVFVPTGSNRKQSNFDLVYLVGDTYYIIEAKGPKAIWVCRTVKPEVLVEITTPSGTRNYRGYSIQGSDEYLEDVLKAMTKPTGNPTKAVAEKLQDAKRAGKLKYISVQTGFDTHGAVEQTVRTFTVNTGIS